MKKEIHPVYGRATIRCACGNTFETGSTVQGTIQVDLCSACHPFFTGKTKIMDTAGRIDRFQKKFKDKVASAPKSSEPVKKGPTKLQFKPQSLKEKLQAAKEKAAAKNQ